MQRSKTSMLWAAAMGVLLCAAQSAKANTVYTFEGLNTGNVSGQDSWVFAGSATRFIVPATIINPGPWNGARVIQSQNLGSVAHRIYRIHDAPFFTGNETAAFIQFDMTHYAINQGAPILFHLGTNTFDPNHSPWIGVRGLGTGQGQGPGIDVRQGGGGGQTQIPIANVDANVQNNDWIRLRLVMNFQAGTMSAYYQNLTQGHAGFTTIVSDLAIFGAPPAAGVAPNTWNTLVLRSDDNNVNRRQIDNLTVGVIPEPSGLALLGLNAAFGAGLLRRRRS